LSGHSDEEAGGAIAKVAKENADACKRFLDILGAGSVDWKALRPVHAHLLSGGSGGSRNWSEIAAHGFVEDYFKKVAQAQRDAAERQAYLSVGIAAVTF